ncbi:MAG TPA: TIGR02221 family CRISPR-associated protein, partial [Phaeodactylibacter sp.]|nr:TIGR02221 family CRISPR-associated protein [Phaeodactylibacter sp.]
EYRKATYSIDGTVIGESSFVSAILYDHFEIDNLLLIGTARSMWEEVYRYFCQKNNHPLDEDYYLKLAELAENADHKTSFDKYDFHLLEKTLGNQSKIKLIPYGLNKNELWQIFNTLADVFKQLDADHKIYLDITHAFRSLPLFSLTAFMYLKDTIGREANIGGIYYGMLETMREFDGIAPIVDLSLIVELQNWIKAAHSFLNYGKGYLAADLLADVNQADTLRQFSDALGANHLEEIRTQIHKFNALAKKIDGHIAKMFLPEVLLDFTKRMLDTKSNAEFQLQLSIWHLEKKNYFSAYIVFVESLVTYVCEKKELDWTDKGKREKAKKILKKKKLYGGLTDIFIRNRKIRNDLAHSRIVSKEDKTRIDVSSLKEDQTFFKNYLKKTKPITTMLLNLSNHPSTKWTTEQRAAAIERYGGVQDMPFPRVPPEASTDQVRQMAESHYVRIRKIAPAAVHLMGEMTFTHALVNKLQQAGIPCVASTTHREVIDEGAGKKTVQFRFVQFRPYP